MTLLLVFAVTLLLAVLVSEVAERSILSASILFLAAGFLVGKGVFSAPPQLNPQLLQRMSEIVLFSILFIDGIRTGGMKSIARFWRLPSRTLFVGMPLTIPAQPKRTSDANNHLVGHSYDAARNLLTVDGSPPSCVYDALRRRVFYGTGPLF
jgi:hypothetical protein